jgi:hypothetical protein
LCLLRRPEPEANEQSFSCNTLPTVPSSFETEKDYYEPDKIQCSNPDPFDPFDFRFEDPDPFLLFLLWHLFKGKINMTGHLQSPNLQEQFCVS